MQPQAKDSSTLLFEQCRFVLVQTKSLPETLLKQVSSRLSCPMHGGTCAGHATGSNIFHQHASSIENYGGEVLKPDAKGKLPITHATHVISNTIDFPEFTEAEALMVPVVNTDWVKISIQRSRQAQVRPYSPDPRMIFSDVILTCADLPLSDKEAITGATMALGGMESKDVTKTTTHICALTMDHPKCQEAVKRKLRCKIVLPHW